MSAEIVNLRRARKTKTRTQASAEAAENRAFHGRSRAERNASEAAERQAVRHFEGHKLSPSARDEG